MVRAPCCEKMGLKKGPWTPEEDKILTDYIKAYGHSNWRALPKLAGLLRCGKSCRLRWINYLRPDIKRGNFTREEEDTIIQLHQMLGNRWSAIAAGLPGRTDNEIKNVWHTHLKKRLKQNHDNEDTDTGGKPFKASKLDTDANKEQDPANGMTNHMTETESQDTRRPVLSPSQSSWSSDITSSNITKSQLDDSNENDNNYSSANTHGSSSSITMHVESPRYFPEVDESFWSKVLSSDTSDDQIYADVGNDFRGVDIVDYLQWQFPLSPLRAMERQNTSEDTSDNVDFWLDVFTRATLPEM